MNAYGALYQISVSLECTGKQPCRLPPLLARNNLRNFMLTALKAAMAVTLHASGVRALFSPMGEWVHWQIGGTGMWRWCQCWIRQQWAQHAEQTPWRDALSWDLRWRSPQVATPHYVSLYFFFFLVSCRFELPLVGGEVVCYIHLILHDMEKVSQRAIFDCFKLHDGSLPSLRLVPCSSWEAVNAVTYAYGISFCFFFLFF